MRAHRGRFVRRWGDCAGESFLIVATSDPGGPAARWQVDLAAGTVSLASSTTAGPGEPGSTATWQLIGPAATWERVLSEEANLNVVLRHRELRFCASDQAPARTVTRVGMLADLLGLTSWRTPETASPTRQRPAA